MKGLYALKPWYSRRLGGFTGWAVRRGISPDVFTVVGVLGGALFGMAIAVAAWPLALVGLIVRLGGANLDGAVARARHVARPWGFALNEIGDRTSDLLMFAGMAALAAHTRGGWGDPAAWTSWPVLAVLLSALAATLPTFASLSLAGAGGIRRNGGPLGKTERCALAVLAAGIPSWTPWIALVIVAGSLLTASTRFAAGHRELTAGELMAGEPTSGETVGSG